MTRVGEQSCGYVDPCSRPLDKCIALKAYLSHWEVKPASHGCSVGFGICKNACSINFRTRGWCKKSSHKQTVEQLVQNEDLGRSLFLEVQLEPLQEEMVPGGSSRGLSKTKSVPGCPRRGLSENNGSWRSKFDPSRKKSVQM